MTEHTGPCAELTDVTVRFGGVVALNTVSIRIDYGEIVGLIGPNGAGKTTLLNVLAGTVRASSGHVTCFGERATGNSTVRQARLGIARTFQQLSLLREMTVREHVLFGYFAAVRPKMPLGGYFVGRPRLEAMAAADTSPLAPNKLLERFGLLPVADQLAAEQSVGMARMVDLARALAMRPKILLLDEPVSGLSETEAEAVATILHDIRSQHRMGVLVVEHNMSFAREVSERMVALDFGEIIAQGSSEEVLTSPRLQAAYFGMVEQEQALAELPDEVVSEPAR